MNKKVCIIISNFKGKFEVLEIVILSIINQSYPVENIHVVMVNYDFDFIGFISMLLKKASDDMQKEFIKRNIHSVPMEIDYGLSYMRNLGLKYARETIKDFDYVMFLDNDAVLDPECIRTLVFLAERNNIGILQPLTIFWHEKVPQSCGFLVDTLGFEHLVLPREMIDLQEINYLRKKYHDWGRSIILVDVDKNGLVPIHYAIGCAMFFSRKCIDRLCCFNEDIFFWRDDTEICIRALKLGYRIYGTTKAKVYHMEQARTRKREIHSFINSEKGRMIVLLILDYRRKRFWLSKVLFKFLIAEILNLFQRMIKDQKSFIVSTKAMLSILGNIVRRGIYYFS